MLAQALGKAGPNPVPDRKDGQEDRARGDRRDARAAADAQHLGNMIYPHRHPQERFYSILPFVAQHGLELIGQLYDAVEPMCTDHRVHMVAG